MSSIIYVSEPEGIGLEVVAETLEGKDIEFVAGTTSFTASQDREYNALLIRSATKVDNTIKDYFPELKSVIRVGVGLDNVDLEYCRREGIAVYNAPGANADAVSEYVVAVMLYVLRGLNRLTTQRVEEWDRFALRGNAIREQTIGIIGYGHIGRLLYEKLNCFSSPEFLVYDPYVRAEAMSSDNVQLTTLDKLLETATVISLHLPLTPETNHLINGEKLLSMQDGTVLINASRGGIVDEEALLKCLTTGKKLTYVADVVEGEPKVNKKLLENDSVIITPHIASLTAFSEKEMVRQSLGNYLQAMPARVFG